MQLQRLRKTEKKRVKQFLLDVYGYELPSGYSYFVNSRNKIFMVAAGMDDLLQFKLDRVGLYIGEMNETEFRLSFCALKWFWACQGPSKNQYELTQTLTEMYMRGQKIPCRNEGRHFYTLVFNNEPIAIAKAVDGTLLNYVPKAFRGEIIL